MPPIPPWQRPCRRYQRATSPQACEWKPSAPWSRAASVAREGRSGRGRAGDLLLAEREVVDPHLDVDVGVAVAFPTGAELVPGAGGPLAAGRIGTRPRALVEGLAVHLRRVAGVHAGTRELPVPLDAHPPVERDLVLRVDRVIRRIDHQ